jgi:chromosome segregation protein
VHVFATLFPGGEGRLVLTDPEDLLTTGIEVLARPGGKKVSRLSLLSGGERSLTAIAFLVALFRARPSPFYVMDEVEAALDDRNLGGCSSCSASCAAPASSSSSPTRSARWRSPTRSTA